MNPSSVITQGQYLGLGQTPAEGLQADQGNPKSPETLAHYNPNCPMIISADASNTGIGQVLFQVQDNGEHLPSKSLSDTEKRYAII